MLIIIGVLGGMSLFLYGMQLCSDGLQKAAAGKLKGILHKLTANRVLAVIVGAVVTALLQSSSATTVMLVGLTNAGLMQLTQTFGVILGADIGTTFTVQLIAFNIYDYALLIVTIGFLCIFAAKKQRTRYIGQVILGFGLIFYGISVMAQSVLPLRDSPIFTNLITQFAAQPLLALLVAAVFCASVHSSAATIGLALSLSGQGLLPLETAIYIMLGANIGTTATALLSSIGTIRESKQVALAHVLFKVLGVLICIPFTGPFTQMVSHTATDVTRQIANAHTIFNVGITLIFLPFVGLLAKLIERLIPQNASAEPLNKPKFLDRQALGSPSLALDLAEQEVLRVADIVRGMVDSVGQLIEGWQEVLVVETRKREEAVDSLCVEISHYLSDASQNSLSEVESQRMVRLLQVLNDLEHVGDTMTGLAHQAQKKINGGLSFSEPGQKEMIEFYNRVHDIFTQAMKSLAEGNGDLAKAVLVAQTEAVLEERELRERHIARLQAGLSLSRETSSIHLDALMGLRRIADHAAGIAHTVLDGYKGVIHPIQSDRPDRIAEPRNVTGMDLPHQAEG